MPQLGIRSTAPARAFRRPLPPRSVPAGTWRRGKTALHRAVHADAGSQCRVSAPALRDYFIRRSRSTPIALIRLSTSSGLSAVLAFTAPAIRSSRRFSASRICCWCSVGRRRRARLNARLPSPALSSPTSRLAVRRQTTLTALACRPFGPWVVSNCTCWPSDNSR